MLDVLAAIGLMVVVTAPFWCYFFDRYALDDSDDRPY